MKRFRISQQPADVVRHLVAAWLWAVLMGLLFWQPALRQLDELRGLQQMPFWVVPVFTVLGTGLLTLVNGFYDIKIPERWSIPVLFAAAAGLTLWVSFSRMYLCACLIVLAILMVYAARGWQAGLPDKPSFPGEDKPSSLCGEKTPSLCGEKTTYRWLAIGFGVGFFLLVAWWTAARVYTFSCPNYDFGLFAQMFHNMKETGLPMTTLERDKWMSHFHVHMSPVYYLMLPVYWLFPHPETLQVLQALVMALAAIPLWKIGRHHGLPSQQRLLLCLLLLLFPAFAGGAAYDLHENCFLTLFLLWLFYAIDREKPVMTAVAAALTLTVKEDAAVYVAVIGLWLMVRSVLRGCRKEKANLIMGAGLLAGALLCFFATTGYLATVGEGVMTGRYDNFMYDKSGSLLTVVKAVIMNPFKALYECADPKKLRYIGATMLPLLCLPLLTRRYERLILLIPYVLVNLMSDYPYQHDLFFQYSFGSAAFLLYLTAVNLADWRSREKRQPVMLTAVVLSACAFGFFLLPRMEYVLTASIRNRAHFEQMHRAVEVVPRDASVAAATFLTPALAQREIVYDIHHCSREHLAEADYVVLQTGVEYNRYKTDTQTGWDWLQSWLKEENYIPIPTGAPTVLVYQKPGT